jgi:hypothetical protein
MEADWWPRCFLQRNWSYLAHAGTSGDVGLPSVFLLNSNGFAHGYVAFRTVTHN